ncbi:MAG: diguanylate cyclase [Lachnospiraceae bacterium]|nr:diguanylate cyclase [Lachnospiraceae bacterium]
MKLFQKIEVWAREFVAIEIIILIILVFIGLYENYQNYSYSKSTRIGDEWVDENGTTIPINGFPDVENVNFYSINYTFQQTDANQVLALRARHVFLDIYVDDVLVSSDKEIQGNLFCSTTGNRWHFIPLGKHDTPVTVHIDATLAFDSSRCAINRIYTGSYQEVTRAVIVPLLGTYLASFVLFIVGLILFFSYIFLKRKLPMGRDIIYLSISTMLITAWTTMESLFLQFLFGYTEFFQLCTYLSLIAIPLPIGLLAYYRLQKKGKLFAGIYVALSILNVPITCILHLTGISNFHDQLTITHILLGLMVPLLALLIKSYLADEITKKHKKTLFALLLTTSICIIIGLGGYILDFFADSAIMALVAVTCLNIFLLLYNFNVFMDMYRKGLEADFVHELALRDYMTNLYNRTGFAEHQSTYNRLINHKTPLGVLQFDLNNLKTVNDTLGHDQGDLLISSFAACLTASFVGKGNCYRMGGDEFLVILNGQDPEKDYRIGIDALRQYCDDYNHTVGISYCMEAAHGFVLSQGMPLAEAMAMADAKMYETKKMLKQEKALNE